MGGKQRTTWQKQSQGSCFLADMLRLLTIWSNRKNCIYWTLASLFCTNILILITATQVFCLLKFSLLMKSFHVFGSTLLNETAMCNERASKKVSIYYFINKDRQQTWKAFSSNVSSSKNNANELPHTGVISLSQNIECGDTCHFLQFIEQKKVDSQAENSVLPWFANLLFFQKLTSFQ